MSSRTLVCLLLVAGAAPAQGTRERGRFSLQGDPATLVGLDAPVKTALIAFSSGGICVFPTDQRVVSVFSCPIHKKSITGAAFVAPDAKTLATSSLDGTLRLWETADLLKHRKTLEDSNGDGKPELPKPSAGVTAHSGSGVTALAVSPDGKRLATGSTEGTVKLWDADGLKPVATLSGAHPGAVRSIQFSPDGKVLASAGTDKVAKLWDVSKEKPAVLFKLDGHEGPVNAVAFSPDGKWVATGTGVAKKSGSVHVWDAGTGKPAYKLEGAEDVVTCLVFHPKTDHLASGGADKKIRVWDLAAKKELYADEHGEPLRNLVISPDGVRFGSCSDRSVRWWAGFGK